jgi:hypothetical protein
MADTKAPLSSAGPGALMFVFDDEPSGFSDEEEKSSGDCGCDPWIPASDWFCDEEPPISYDLTQRKSIRCEIFGISFFFIKFLEFIWDFYRNLMRILEIVNLFITIEKLRVLFPISYF